MQTESSTVSTRDLRILLVEDDELLGPILKRQLSYFASYVQLVAEPKSFLVGMTNEEASFDLAVVDLGLPGLSGNELISWMRSSVDTWIASLPILVVTGSHEKALGVTQSGQVGVQVITKPYSFNDLKLALETLLPNRKLH